MGIYSFMISTNQKVICIDNIKCQINDSIFSKKKKINLNHKVTFNFYLIIDKITLNVLYLIYF